MDDWSLGGAERLPLIFPNGDQAERQGHVVTLSFAGPRRVLSTSAWQGGIREDLRCVYNYDMSHGKTTPCLLLEPTMAGHMRRTAELLGLPRESTGLCTAAQMENIAVCRETWGEDCVTALVTAGIDENGGRAGDPATWEERGGRLGIPVGTINLLLHMNCDLPAGTLAGALLTVTEAKCAAVQELQLPSVVSSGLATGSGTDGAILICDPNGPRRSDAGKHSKLGELVGRAVLRAVREALLRQTGASPARLRDARRLLGRFGLTLESLRELAPGVSTDAWDAACRKEVVWTTAALLAHLLDQVAWGVFSPQEAQSAAGKLLPLEGNGLIEAFGLWLAAQAAEIQKTNRKNEV